VPPPSPPRGCAAGAYLCLTMAWRQRTHAWPHALRPTPDQGAAIEDPAVTYKCGRLARERRRVPARGPELSMGERKRRK